MGKRKPSKRPQVKKKGPLSSTFGCLFCNHENSVNVKLDKKLGLGILSCKVCGQNFQTGINYLSAAVDVYGDWVDACDKVAKDACVKNDEDRQRRKHRANPAPDTRYLEPAGTDENEEDTAQRVS